MNEKKKLVGFFKELPHGLPDGASLMSAIANIKCADEANIVNYLSKGTIICASAGPGKDVLSPTKKLICPSHILTDGLWIWPLDLAYYVEIYHATLPVEFVTRMRSLHWTPPQGDALMFDLPSPEECDIL